MASNETTSKTTVEVDVGHVNIEAAGGYFCKDTTDINVLLVGRSQTGKTSILEAFKNPAFQKGKGAFADTREPSCYRLILVDSTNKQAYQLNVIDTPGLKELRTNANEDRTDSELLNLASMCVEKSLTTLHAICLVTQAGNITREDVHTFKTLINYIGPNLSNNCMMILTHGDRFKNEKLEEFQREIKGREDIRPVIDFCKLGIFYHGILDKDDLDQYEDAELRDAVKTSKLKRLAPMRTKLIQKLVECANKPCQLKELSELEQASKPSRQKAFLDAWRGSKCLVM